MKPHRSSQSALFGPRLLRILAGLLLTLPWVATLPAAEEPAAENEPTASTRVADRAEVRGVLDDLVRAYAEEDSEGIYALMKAEGESFRIFRSTVEQLFEKANFFELSFDDLVLVPTEDDALAGHLLQTLTFRSVGSKETEGLRNRLGIRLERNEAGRLVITTLRSLPDPALPLDNPVRAEHYDLEIALRPEGREMRVEGEVELANVSLEDAGRFHFVLDGFAEELEVFDLAGDPLETSSRRGGSRLVEVVLPEPLPSGERSGFRFRYTIRRPFVQPAAKLAPAEVYFLEGSPWFPRFRALPEVQEPSFTFDLRARVPQGWRLVSSGRLSMEEDGAVHHWWSPFAVGEIALVAGPLRLLSPQEVFPEGTPGPMRFQVWIPEGEPVAPRGTIVLERIARAYEETARLLGEAPPHTEVQVVFTSHGNLGFYGGALLWVLDREWLHELPRWHPDIARSYGHQAAHAWFVQGVRPAGPGAAFVREGPSELLGLLGVRSRWGEDAMHKDLALYRNDLEMMLVPPEPLGLVEDPDGTDLEVARIEGSLLLNELRHWIGEEHLLRGLAAFVGGNKGGQASIWDLQASLASVLEQAGEDPDRDLVPFFADFLYQRSAPDPAFAEVEVAEPEPNGLVPVRFTVVNEGTGRTRVPWEIRLTSGERVPGLLWLDPGERREVRIEVDAPVRRIVLDPTGALYQKSRRNDWWPHPPQRNKRGWGEERFIPDRERFRR